MTGLHTCISLAHAQASAKLVNNSATTVDVLVEQGLFAYNVTFLSQDTVPDLPFPAMNITVVLGDEAEAGNPAVPGGGADSGSGVQGWRVTLIVVIPVVAVVVAVAVAGFLFMRRRQLANVPRWSELPSKGAWRTRAYWAMLLSPSPGSSSHSKEEGEAGGGTAGAALEHSRSASNRLQVRCLLACILK
jgi:hypothetical protein